MERALLLAERDVPEEVLNCIDEFWLVYSIASAALVAANKFAAYSCCITDIGISARRPCPIPRDDSCLIGARCIDL